MNINLSTYENSQAHKSALVKQVFASDFDGPAGVIGGPIAAITAALATLVKEDVPEHLDNVARGVLAEAVMLDMLPEGLTICIDPDDPAFANLRAEEAIATVVTHWREPEVWLDNAIVLAMIVEAMLRHVASAVIPSNKEEFDALGGDEQELLARISMFCFEQHRFVTLSRNAIDTLRIKTGDVVVH